MEQTAVVRKELAKCEKISSLLHAPELAKTHLVIIKTARAVLLNQSKIMSMIHNLQPC